MATSIEFIKRSVLENTTQTPDQLNRLVALAEQQNKTFPEMLLENNLTDEMMLGIMLEEYANEERTAGAVELAENALFARLINQKGWAHASDLWKFLLEQEKDRHQGKIRTIDWYLMREGFLDGDRVLQVLSESSRAALKCIDCGRKMIVRKTGEPLNLVCPDCRGTLEETTDPADFKAEGAKEYDPLIGKTIGGCRIEFLLGKGGMGAVYKAKHLALNKAVAVKVLMVAEMTESAQKRFLREARTAARLEHGNIVQVFDTGQEGESYYIIMQFVDGTTVADRIRTDGPMKVKEAVKIAIEAARGIAAAHAQKMIHRDIKPDNIMLDKSGAVKVADFGLAKDLTSGSNLTMTSQAMGTPSYMSPEQAEDAASVDARSDIYSFGATLYAMLAGTPPYMGSSPWAVVSQHLTAPIPELRAMFSEVPESLSNLVKKLMAKKPDQRPSSMDEVIDELTMIQVSLMTAQAAPPPPPPPQGDGKHGEQKTDIGGEPTLHEAQKPQKNPATEAPAAAATAKKFPVVPVAIGGVVLVAIIVVALVFALPALNKGKNGDASNQGSGQGTGGDQGGSKGGSTGQQGTGKGDGTGATDPVTPAGKMEMTIDKPASGSFHSSPEVAIDGEIRGGSNVKVKVLDEFVKVSGGRFQTKVMLGEGPGSILVQAFNAGDEKNAEMRRIDVIVDTVKPKVALTAPVPSASGPVIIRTQEVDVSVSVEDNYPSKVTIGESEARVEGRNFSARILIPSEGRHMIPVKAWDKAGNVGELIIEIVRDTVVPVITVEKLEEKVLGGPERTKLVFKASEPLSSVSVNEKVLQSAPGERYELEVELKDGSNPVVIQASDLAGNQAKVERSVEFVSDARISRMRDDEAWAKAVEASKAAPDPFDRMTPVRGYISDFPEGAHVAEAGNLVAQLRKAGLPDGVLRTFTKGAYEFTRDSVELVMVQAGEYVIGVDGGKPEEGPAHKVNLSAYLVYKTEVTNEMFARFLNATGTETACPGVEKEAEAWRAVPGAEKLPVTGVTWTEADAYAKWVGGFLPTEAQWEATARGAGSAPYPWGTAMISTDKMNCEQPDAPGKTAPVGSYPAGASPFGAYDMSGNAAEWCLDWFDEAAYASRQSGAKDPVNETASFSRAIRGGAFTSPPENCTVTSRTGLDPDTRMDWIGFRVVLKALP